MTFMTLLRHLRFGDAVFGRGTRGMAAGRFSCGSHQPLKVPTMPLGSNSVTRMNSAPSMNSQYGARRRR